jgi:hypothetical protein
MAARGKVEKGSLEAHARTYGGMISVFKVGSVIVALIAAMVIWLIAG